MPARFSAPDVRLSRLPGWERNSWGYHADDGWAFPGHKDGSPYGPTFDSAYTYSSYVCDDPHTILQRAT